MGTQVKQDATVIYSVPGVAGARLVHADPSQYAGALLVESYANSPANDELHTRPVIVGACTRALEHVLPLATRPEST